MSQSKENLTRYRICQQDPCLIIKCDERIRVPVCLGIAPEDKREQTADLVVPMLRCQKQINLGRCLIDLTPASKE